MTLVNSIPNCGCKYSTLPGTSFGGKYILTLTEPIFIQTFYTQLFMFCIVQSRLVCPYLLSLDYVCKRIKLNIETPKCE